jgi:hypothetical protein
LSVASKYAKNLGKESRFKNGIPGADWVIFYFIMFFLLTKNPRIYLIVCWV